MTLLNILNVDIPFLVTVTSHPVAGGNAHVSCAVVDVQSDYRALTSCRNTTTHATTPRVEVTKLYNLFLRIYIKRK